MDPIKAPSGEQLISMTLHGRPDPHHSVTVETAKPPNSASEVTLETNTQQLITAPR